MVYSPSRYHASRANPELPQEHRMDLALPLTSGMSFPVILILPEFSIHSFVQFPDCNTRSSSHLKLKHFLSKSTTEGHLFFNRLPRLWNSLPPINLELSISTIKAHLHRLFWMKFLSRFDCSNLCSYHYQCPCPKCVSMSIVHSFSSSQF